MANEKQIDLISRNRLENEIQRRDVGQGSLIAKITVSTTSTIIKMIPTEEAVEVVHGHWVSLTECANAGVYCSVCNKKVYKEDYAWCNRKNKLRSNYCPNCGAKMDGGNEDG